MKLKLQKIRLQLGWQAKVKLNQMKKQKGFSLVELSIVSLIIGVIIGGVMGGSNLVKVARISSARSFTAKSIVPEISGLIAWYETSLNNSLKAGENYDGATISRWYDISPGSNTTIIENGRKNFLQRAADSNLTYQADGINKSPSLSFKNNAVLYLTNFYQGSLSQATIFLVFRPIVAPSSTTQFFYDNYYTGQRATIGIKTNTMTMDFGISASTTASSSNFTISDYIAASYINGSSSKIFVNDTTNILGSATVNPGTNSLVGATIGGLGSGSSSTTSQGFTGLISEIIIYNRLLNLQERKDIMNYLSKKYKISVANL